MTKIGFQHLAYAMRFFGWLLVSALVGLLATTGLAQDTNGFEKPNKITFERSEYGLLFTHIYVSDHAVTAMIDFGDPHVLQLSSTLVDRLNIKIKKSGYQVSDINGQVWNVHDGVVNELVVGDWKEDQVHFTMQQGEMEAVSAEIGTEFHAVLGWGYFKRYYTVLEYANQCMLLHTFKDTLGTVRFGVPFDISQNQLLVAGSINGRPYNLMIDTGSPVTVVDSSFCNTSEKQHISFQLDNELIEMEAYPHDLAVLEDLGVGGILGGDFLAQWKITFDPFEGMLNFYK